MKESYEYPNSIFKLFHSTNADRKKESAKKLYLILNWAITKFWLFLVWYELLFVGIKAF